MHRRENAGESCLKHTHTITKYSSTDILPLYQMIRLDPFPSHRRVSHLNFPSELAKRMPRKSYMHAGNESGES